MHRKLKHNPLVHVQAGLEAGGGVLCRCGGMVPARWLLFGIAPDISPDVIFFCSRQVRKLTRLLEAN